MLAIIENKTFIVGVVAVVYASCSPINVPALDQKIISPSKEVTEILDSPYLNTLSTRREIFKSETEIVRPSSYSSYLDTQDNTNWGGFVMTLNERRVIEGLANPEWDFRTVTGLTMETGLDMQYIEGVLKKFPQLIRYCDVPDKQGGLLYTLSDRPKKLREKLALLRVFLAKSL